MTSERRAELADRGERLTMAEKNELMRTDADRLLGEPDRPRSRITGTVP